MSERKTNSFGLRSELTFGKYIGKKLEEVIDEDYKYVRWCLENIEWFDMSEEAEEYLEDMED
jgi:hypothetical protein